MARTEAVEDADRGAVAHLVDQGAHLRHAAGALEQLAVGGLVLLDPAEERVEAARQRLARRQVRMRLCAPPHLLRRLEQRGEEEVPFGREVVVQKRLGDAGLASDPSHRQLGKRVAGEQIGAELEQLAPPDVHLQARIGGFRHVAEPSRC